MAQAKKADEPSMEEILASIRRIISDEDSQGAEDGESGSSEPVETPVEEEAADDMGDASEMSQDDLDKLFDMSSDDEEDLPAEDEDADDMAAAMAIPEDDAMDMVEGMAEDLDGDEGDISFAASPMPEMAFESEPDFDPEPVMATRPVPDDLPNVPDDAPLTSQNTGEAVHAAFDNLSNMFVGSQAQTVEELVKEMLRPMLKAWLDQNLPGMVEQMVQKEIQRVTRRR